MAPCPPLIHVEEDLWNSVKRDSTNIIVLQASVVRASWSAAFGSGSDDFSHRIVVMGDDGFPLAVIAQAQTLAEGEKDWEWAVLAMKTEFRRRAPAQHKLIEHFVALWNKSHPRSVCCALIIVVCGVFMTVCVYVLWHEQMAIAQPQWKKETRTAEIDMKEMRELMQSADSEANILDTASARLLHVIDFVDGFGYPMAPGTQPIRTGLPTRGLRNMVQGQNSPSEHESKHKMYEAALNAYRLAFRQPPNLPGYNHSAGEFFLNPLGPEAAAGGVGPGSSRPMTMMFSTKPLKQEKKRRSFDGKVRNTSLT